ncbi:MFS transporter [Methanobacterium paludis]|uniref:Efflux pump antibiotic resistance protein n=1 Tax=Methanobacterium paludis (strain DSM 25820 / JCM 18151 / SWAN1) TaxID=868131 RepID=F6D5E5_METPW|nr:hypothetical protein [Methanobacterium paludis]AEG18886.1 efflux pump antibiotic resistance protein [Methanobacterium paludis]
MGIVFPHSANEIFSVARRDQQPDASGIMNTGINLGSSLGTAVLGVILILGSFSGLGLALNNTNVPYQQEQIIGIHSWFESIGIGKSGNIDEKQVLVSSKKIDTMKSAFDIIIIVLLIGLVSSLLIPPHKKKLKHVDGCVTSQI